MEEQKESQGWSIFGKISAVIMFILACVQLFEYADSKTSVSTFGFIYPYETIPFYSVDSSKIKSENLNSIYQFNLENNGNNTIEDLIFESPLIGYYKITYPDSSVIKPFNNRFFIGNLRPTYKIKVICWCRKSNENIHTFDNIRLTHKNGSIKIKDAEEMRHFLFISIASVLIIGLLLVIFLQGQLNRQTVGYLQSEIKRLKDNQAQP